MEAIFQPRSVAVYGASRDERKLVRHIQIEIGAYLKQIAQGGFDRLIGTSGTILSLGFVAVAAEHRGAGGTLRNRRIAAKQLRRLRKELAGMTLEQKVSQLIEPDIASITPEDLRHFDFGSILNGGNSSPRKDKLAAPREWLDLADGFYDASMADPAAVLPVLWGTDAVHGHNNIPGATIFPHNIALGATRDPQLIRRIGEITALEIRVTGLDWAFSPTVAVARDARGGRTYESGAENPQLVRRAALADFNVELARARDALARVEKRIERLEQKVEARSANAPDGAATSRGTR